MAFPTTLISWVATCVLQGSSRVIVNGLAGRYINLKRGVRQGDPLSPYLFILAMDYLSRWMIKLHQNGTILLPFQHIQPCLLYADDALFFFKSDTAQCHLLKVVFSVFYQISGLKINPLKSEVVVLNTTATLALELANILDCNLTSFPITYLGLPLSNKKLKREDYANLLQRFKLKLDTWSSSMLSMAGRLTLINSCLSSLPVYFMSVFRLPKWVIHDIDTIRRTYLWQGSSTQTRKLVTVAWDKVCAPKQVGGLGVSDINTFNLTLLAKWLWKWHHQSFSPWKHLVVNLLA